MPDTAVNILWTICVGTFVLLMLAVGFIMAIVQSKRREMIAKQRELEELAKSELKYRNLFENSLAGMVRLSNSWDVSGSKSCFIRNVRCEDTEKK